MSRGENASYKCQRAKTFISERRLDAYCRQQDMHNACHTLNRDCSESCIFQSAPISSSPRSLQFLPFAQVEVSSSYLLMSTFATASHIYLSNLDTYQLMWSSQVVNFYVIKLVSLDAWNSSWCALHVAVLAASTLFPT